VLKEARQPKDPVEAMNLLRRLPRNRLEARRFIATKGRIARV
jgi:hypothetical protein